MFIVLCLWFLGLIGNCLILFPGIELRGGKASLSPWNSSVKIFRVSYASWNLLSLLAYVGIVVMSRIAGSFTQVVCTICFTGVHTGFFLSTSLALIFSVALSKKLTGVKAAGICWLTSVVMSTLLIAVQLALLPKYGWDRGKLVVGWVYFAGVLILYTVCLLFLWVQTYMIQRSSNKLSSQNSVSSRDLVIQSQKEWLKHQLFLYGVRCYSLAWLPYIFYFLTHLYDRGESNFNWREQLNLASSIVVTVSLVFPLAVFLYEPNRRILLLNISPKLKMFVYEGCSTYGSVEELQSKSASVPPTLVLLQDRLYTATETEA